MILAYEKYEELRPQASLAKKKNGRKSLQFELAATFLDAAHLVKKKSWDSIAKSTIIGCWIPSKCLTHPPSVIGSANREYRTQHQAVDSICDLLASISINDQVGLENLKEVRIAGIVDIIKKRWHFKRRVHCESLAQFRRN